MGCEVEPLYSRIHRSSFAVDNELLPLQEDPARATWYLEADHEHRILFLRRNILHVENGRAALQHPCRRYYHTRSFCSPPSIVPSVDPVSHLASPFKN